MEGGIVRNQFFAFVFGRGTLGNGEKSKGMVLFSEGGGGGYLWQSEGRHTSLAARCFRRLKIQRFMEALCFIYNANCECTQDGVCCLSFFCSGFFDLFR